MWEYTTTESERGQVVCFVGVEAPSGAARLPWMLLPGTGLHRRLVRGRWSQETREGRRCGRAQTRMQRAEGMRRKV